MDAQDMLVQSLQDDNLLLKHDIETLKAENHLLRHMLCVINQLSKDMYALPVLSVNDNMQIRPKLARA